jgi:hypothetical protein
MAFDTISNQILDAIQDLLEDEVQDEFVTLSMPAMDTHVIVDEERMRPESWPAFYLIDLNETQKYGDATIDGIAGKQNISKRYDVLWVVKATPEIQDVRRWAVAVGDVVAAIIEDNCFLGGLVYDVNVDSLEVLDPINAGSALICRGRAALTVLHQRTLGIHGAET